MESVIVAGGLNDQGGVLEVEFLPINGAASWKILGLLKHPRFGFPTVGKVLGKGRLIEECSQSPILIIFR